MTWSLLRECKSFLFLWDSTGPYSRLLWFESDLQQHAGCGGATLACVHILASSFLGSTAMGLWRSRGVAAIGSVSQYCISKSTSITYTAIVIDNNWLLIYSQRTLQFTNSSTLKDQEPNIGLTSHGSERQQVVSDTLLSICRWLVCAGDSYSDCISSKCVMCTLGLVQAKTQIPNRKPDNANSS